MAYDEKLAAKLRSLFAKRPGAREIKMMGGLCFMVDGHMCCGVLNDDLVVRVGPQQYREALSRPHARPMDFTGKPSKGFIYVGPAGHRRKKDLEDWVGRAIEFVGHIPPKGR